jgi:hypothetical protein
MHEMHGVENMTEKDYIMAKLDFLKLLMGSVVGTIFILAITTGSNPVAESVGFIILLIFFISLGREYYNCMIEIKAMP